MLLELIIMLKIKKEKNSQYIVSLFQVTRINRLFTELLSKELKELLSEPGIEVYFNLEGITFIDSEGFRVLMDADDFASSNNSTLHLCNIGDELKELFHLLSLEERFRICKKDIGKEKILVEVEL